MAKRDLIYRETARRIIDSPRSKQQMLTVLSNTPSVPPEDEWIPVSKPPKVGGKYLVTLHYNTHDTVETAYYSKNLYKVDEYDFYDKRRPGWYNYDSEYGHYEQTDVIAWCKLIEPYKEGE